jgi:hypothetical protein
MKIVATTFITVNMATVPPPGPDPLDSFAQNLFLFQRSVELLVDERLYLENSRPAEIGSDIQLQILMDNAMAMAHRLTHERARELFSLTPTSREGHALRYAASMLAAEKLAVIIKMPASHFSVCITNQLLKKMHT